MEYRVGIARLLEQLADLRKHRKIRSAGTEPSLETYRFRHVLNDAYNADDLMILIR